MKKGGLARRAGFLKQTRADTVSNLTLEAGNFAPLSRNAADSGKVRALVDFYRQYHYDAVGLSTRETQFGFDQWKQAFAGGLPVVAANVFTDQRGKKPAFEPYVIKNDHGNRLGVVGFVSESAWKARKDTATALVYKSPWECGKLIRKAAKKSDHLTVIGEFTQQQAESLIKAYPDIDVVISSGIRTDQPMPFQGSVIVGVPPRGNQANYLDWNFAAVDSATHTRFRTRSQALDGSVLEDSTAAGIIARSKQTPAAQPTAQQGQKGK